MLVHNEEELEKMLAKYAPSIPIEDILEEDEVELLHDETYI